MTSSQSELRVERIAIMTAEKESPEEIEKVLRQYPGLYGIQKMEEEQGELL